MPTQTPPTLCPLPSIRFIKVTGADAEGFLNAQLSQDVAAAPSDRAPLAAWHDARGRVLALLRALRRGEEWLLLAHGAEVGELIRQLTVFVLRADVKLRDVSAEWRGAVTLGDIDRWLEGRGATLGPDPGDAASVDGMLVIRAGPTMAYLAATEKAFRAIETQFSVADSFAGELAEIRSGLVNVPPELAGRFSPQMLNLDRLGAVSFDKGCYPGQEVIARTHNLGSVKRRVFRFSGRLGEAPPLGAALIDPAGTQVGEIVRAARASGGDVELLAVVTNDAMDERLVCAGEPETPLTRESLPGDEPGPHH